ncbi:MAG: TIGR02466 family protein [Reyranellaceae bacterium]
MSARPSDMRVIELFPTPLWQVDLEAAAAQRLNAKLRREIDAMLSPRPPLPRGGSWQTEPVLHRHPGFAELVDLVERTALGALKFLALKHPRAKISGMWANINPRGGQSTAHTHPNNFLSAVYYVQVPRGEGVIQFTDPRPQAEVMLPPVVGGNRFNGSLISLDVLPGRLVMFPAWLRHKVPPNQGDEERISIAVNLMLEHYVETASPPLWTGSAPVDPGSLKS